MVKKVFKWFIVCILMSLPVFTLVQTLDIFAQDQVNIEIHYLRPDGNYTGWSVWIWEPGRDGQAVEFEEVGPNGAVARITLATQASEIGFIVRLNDWEQKDTDADRFITVVEGKALAYVKSGDSTVYDNPQYRKPDVVVLDGEVVINIHYRRFDGQYT